MKIIKDYLILGFVLFITVVVACSGDNNNEVEPEITVAKKEMDFSKTGGTDILSIKSNVSLDVTSNQGWCKVEPVASTSGTTFKYSIIVEANATTDERVAEVTIQGGSVVETVNVVQSAADALIVKKTSYQVRAEGETIAVELQTIGDYQITINDEDWISKEGTRTLTDKTEKFIIAPNYLTGKRVGSITFVLADLTETISIEQEGMDIPAADKSGMDKDAVALVKDIYAGWNLGNTLEACTISGQDHFTWGSTTLANVNAGETLWRNPVVTQDLISTVKNAGFNAIRIPCAWYAHFEDEVNYTIKPEWLKRVREVVDYCYKEGLYVILNVHWDTGWLENNCMEDVKDRVNKVQEILWTQIATYFRSYDEHLLFAGCNEPNADSVERMAVLKSYEQTFVNVVRATGGKNVYRNLIIQGPNTDIETTYNIFGSMPTDVVSNRLMAEVHYYTPWQFCGMTEDASWGKMFYYWGEGYHVEGSERNATWGEEGDMKVLFQKVKTQFVDHGIPVILGEYGVARRSNLTGSDLESHLKSRAYYNQYVTEQAKNYGLAPFYWDNGGDDFSLINRESNTIGDSQLWNAIMEGAKNGNYPY